MTIELFLNGEHKKLTAQADLALSQVLQLECRGVNPGCGKGYCGCCTVLLNGKLTYSCQIPFFSVKNQSIMTVEGIQTSNIFSDILKGMKRAKLDICDYCAPARTLSFYSLLKRADRPNNQEIQEVLSSIHCSCTHIPLLNQAIFYSLEEKYTRLHG
ncbi:MAG: 2Fe-2S iron-sulfur cluster-binding protein [Spirochaetaceae bacterium]|nr:2Fe-2S iron-sulfur cluster-binding protein [Spirochaetaceae bacterium]